MHHAADSSICSLYNSKFDLQLSWVPGLIVACNIFLVKKIIYVLFNVFIRVAILANQIKDRIFGKSIVARMITQAF